VDQLEKQLTELRSGKSKKIRGLTVRRVGDDYSVGDEEGLTLEEAKTQLANREGAQRSGGIPYHRVVFFEKTIKIHRLKNRAEHLQLIDAVLARKRCLFYADVIERDGKFYASSIHIVDWETIPDVEETKTTPTTHSPETWNGSTSCPFCGKACSSTSGRTLHVKDQHPTRLDEYRELVQEREEAKRAKATVPTVNDDDEDDVVARLRESSNDPSKYPCPFCSACPTSSPGRTLHVKSKHPDRLKEYLKGMNG
jgi:hypothetical protein